MLIRKFNDAESETVHFAKTTVVDDSKNQTTAPSKNLNAKDVAKRFDECVSVMARLPSELRFNATTYWPQMVLTPKELARQEKKTVTPLRPTPDAIDRAEVCLSWITWVNPGERKLIWLRAQRMSWRGIAHETGFPKTSAQRYWLNAVEKIAARLRNEG